MLKQALTVKNSDYLKLSQFNSLSEFEEYYLEEWLRNHGTKYLDVLDGNGVPINPYIITSDEIVDIRPSRKRSGIINGQHIEKDDEKDRLDWLKDCFQINTHTNIDSISLQILAKDNLEIQKMMFSRCMFEFDELHYQILQKRTIIEKYPFIIDEFLKLKDAVLNKCGYLIEVSVQPTKLSKANINPMKTSDKQKMIWNSDAVALFTLFADCMYTFRTPQKKPFISNDADAVVNFILENFTDSSGQPFEIETIKDYIYLTPTGKPKKEAKRNRLKIGT